MTEEEFLEQCARAGHTILNAYNKEHLSWETSDEEGKNRSRKAAKDILHGRKPFEDDTYNALFAGAMVVVGYVLIECLS